MAICPREAVILINRGSVNACDYFIISYTLCVASLSQQSARPRGCMNLVKNHLSRIPYTATYYTRIYAYKTIEAQRYVRIKKRKMKP